jgi:hypothetical protein
MVSHVRPGEDHQSSCGAGTYRPHMDLIPESISSSINLLNFVLRVYLGSSKQRRSITLSLQPKTRAPRSIFLEEYMHGLIINDIFPQVI